MEDEEIKGVLFILKESLVANGDLSPGYRKPLKKIISLLEEDSSLLKLLSKWKFIEKQLPYLLRSSKSRSAGFLIATSILQLPEATLPPVFVTKKGGFFFSELLYESIDNPTEVIRFCKEAIRKSPLFMNILHDCGFFILLNSFVSYETAEFYSEVFAYRQYEDNLKQLRKGGGNVMYEIRRKYFDPEIVFREEVPILLKEPPSMHKTAQQIHKAIFDDLYNTTFFNLLDIGLEVNLHVMNYCTWDCLLLCGSSDLRALIINNNYLAIRLYRKVLEHLGSSTETAIYLSKTEDDDLMIHIAKLLEEKETYIVMECALILYSYYRLFDWNIDQKQFTEARIRRIFSLLELGSSGCVCLGACVPETHGESKGSVSLPKHGIDLQNGMAACAFPICLESCNTRKILTLLSKVYSKVDKEYFYKPSFLVLMMTWNDIFAKHGCWEFFFFMEFFSDFVSFLGKNSYNFARIIFPFRKTRKKSRTALDDTNVGRNTTSLTYTDDPDIGEISELAPKLIQDAPGSDYENNSNEMHRRTRSRKVLDSESETFDMP